jgi:Protein of unknown function (DUF2815)
MSCRAGGKALGSAKSETRRLEMANLEAVKKDIILNDVLISRVSLTEPFHPRVPQIDSRTGKAKADKYHVDVILSPTHPQFAELERVIGAVANAGWGDKTQQILASIKGVKQQFCLQRGDLHRADKAEYAGMVYVSAGNEIQPTIGYTENGVNIFNRGTPTMAVPSDEKWPYAGSYDNVHLQFYTYTYNNSPGLGCGLLGVQFNRHGTRLTGATVSSGKEFGLVLGQADKAAPTVSQAPGGGLI